MASILNPYLSFDGTAREAMEFYREVFGGELNVNTYGELGGTEGEDAKKLMHSSLTTPGGFTLMGADTPPGQPLQRGNDVAISLSGDDESELTGYWEKLSDGGTVAVPIEKQMWGDTFGMCQDKYGTTWMVNIAGTPS
jgi:PhnB protein